MGLLKKSITLIENDAEGKYWNAITVIEPKDFASKSTVQKVLDSLKQQLSKKYGNGKQSGTGGVWKSGDLYITLTTMPKGLKVMFQGDGHKPKIAAKQLPPVDQMVKELQHFIQTGQAMKPKNLEDIKEVVEEYGNTTWGLDYFERSNKKEFSQMVEALKKEYGFKSETEVFRDLVKEVKKTGLKVTDAYARNNRIWLDHKQKAQDVIDALKRKGWKLTQKKKNRSIFDYYFEKDGQKIVFSKTPKVTVISIDRSN